MSTDLQFPTPPILNRPFLPSSSPPATTDTGSIPQSIPESKPSADSEERESPTTPTAEEHRIPVPTSPPPAPQKRRRVEFPACKRRLDFFDATHSKEVDDFFASRFAEIQSRRLLKRRCPCS